MSEIKHTQAPWMLNGEAQLLTEGDVIHISDLAGRNLATVWTSKQQTYGVGRANAQRIVYCVNACEGVSPEDLKGLSVKGLLDGYLQDVKAKKELEKRLESARADAKHLKELYEYVGALNSRQAEDKRELEKALDEENKRHKVTAEREDVLAKEVAKLSRELAAANGRLLSEQSAFETMLKSANEEIDKLRETSVRDIDPRSARVGENQAYCELVAKLRTAIRWARLSDNEWVNFRVLEDMLDGALSND